MDRRWILVAATWWLTVTATGGAQDVVNTAKRKLTGTVSRATATDVTVSVGSVSESVPVNEIESITFKDEPAGLVKVRGEIAAGRYEQALAAIEKIELADSARAEVKQDMEFYKAMAAARLALEGQREIAAAGKDLAAFASAYPDSYHHFEASAVVGDLLLAVGQFAKAREYYERLSAKAPWPDYKMRSAVAVGRAWLAEGKADAALKSFEAALAANATGPRADAYRRAAAAGKARCLAEANQPQEAIRLADDVIAQADPADVELLAEAYNAKGIALRRAGKLQEALFALLHVDTLYADARQAHAVALVHLVQLWKEVKRPDRAVEAQRALESLYKESPWLKALKEQK